MKKKTKRALILHAPNAKINATEQHRSYQDTLASGVGSAYAISKAKRALISDDGSCAVILLCNDSPRPRRAEGTLVELTEVGKTENNITRYDVRICGLKEKPYRWEETDRRGVGVTEIGS